ncbi:hypothetical protein E2C01_028102 [Portunus trituberculatus]|uniref:Uncharacterized protein n=1 Tax=Portunus trituberculatus TaxID=210409 RepID=A0A5B7EP59_PORTR|nr:hypothetical protein [Portunus trituberculatus]
MTEGLQNELFLVTFQAHTLTFSQPVGSTLRSEDYNSTRTTRETLFKNQVIISVASGISCGERAKRFRKLMGPSASLVVAIPVNLRGLDVRATYNAHTAGPCRSLSPPRSQIVKF